jgi:lipoate-protein ligase A
MLYYDTTLPTAAENLAFDEALLEDAEQDQATDREAIRLWELKSPAIVIGRASRIEEEVYLETARRMSLPVLRRCSGGSTVLLGRGCLIYSLLLSYELRPAIRGIDQAHRLVIGKLHRAIANQLPDVEHRDVCDLVWRGKKFSGNALRCKRTHLLYHGTILYDFPIRSVGELLREPPRQPDYRARRSHSEFVDNVPVDRDLLIQDLCSQWQAESQPSIPNTESIHRLVELRYGRDEWHARR